MRATTIFHPVLVIGTAPTEAVLAVAYACRSRAPYRPLTLIVAQARVESIRRAAPPGATVLGFEGDRFGLDNISVRGLAARLSATDIDEILIAATAPSTADYRHAIRAARRFGAFPRRIRFAQVSADGGVSIRPLYQQRLREGIGLLAGPPDSALRWAGLAVAAAMGSLGLDQPAAPWVCLLLAHALTAVSQRQSWGEYTGDATVHLQIARRTGAGDLFAFNPGPGAAGSSSPLWTLLLGACWAMGIRRHLDRAARVTAALSAHLALAALAAAAYTWLGNGPAWGLAPLLLAAVPSFHIWTARAMETSLAVLLGALAAGVTLGGHGLPAAVTTGVFALALLVRWEHAALLAPMLLVAAWQQGPWLLTASLPLLAIAVWNLARSGSPIADTATARRRAALASASAHGWAGALRGLVVAQPVLVLAIVAGVLAAVSGPAPGPAALTASLVLCTVCFSAVVPTTYDERYLLPSMPAALLLAVSVLDLAPAGPVHAASLVLAAGLTVERVAALVRGWPGRRFATARSRRYDREFRARVAADIDARLPRHGILACIEIDLRWFMPRRDTQVVGLNALIDRTVAPALACGRFGDLLRRRAVSHVLVEENLHERAGWRDTDLHALVGRHQSVEIPGAGRLMPVRAWAYRNWGDGTPVRWVLWELTGDTMALPPATAGARVDEPVPSPADEANSGLPMAA